jgi:hypothetical protein
MMNKMHLLLPLILLPVAALFAFNPPIDTQKGVTLRIDGVGKRIATDQPFAFTVHLQNNGECSVSGTVAVALNDDWSLPNSNRFAVALAPGQTWQTSCSAAARPRVLPALYPVHARFAFLCGTETIELHPIAIFKAAPPKPENADVPAAVAVEPGIGSLFAIPPSSAWSRGGRVFALPVGFEGSEHESGTTLRRETVERSGDARAALAIHPPWKGGWGTLWSDYRVALPTNTPIHLTFATAIRDSHPGEPRSDGVEFRVQALDAAGTSRELFRRFTDSKTWLPADVDLSAYAGQTVALRLWNGPGPKNDTTCDNGLWGDPRLIVGALPPPVAETDWQSRTAEALRLARTALGGGRRAPLVFLLARGDERYGAAVVLGREGLTDAVFAFSDGANELAFRGFSVAVDDQTLGRAHDGQPIPRVDTARDGDAWVVTHRARVPLRATLRADHGTLRVSWDMPNVVRNPRGEPRFTQLALGAADRPFSRVYLGFGAVFDGPGAFTIPYSGVQLGTRHIGADYPGGLSFVQASDLVPDNAVCAPTKNLFSLETPHDACFLFAPSAHGAFAAARTYREVSGFEKARGVDTLLGRVCFDQWGGDYRVAAKDLGLAAKYGLNHAIFIKHGWQRWGYDYRLPDIYPPEGGLEPFLEMRNAAKQAGILFAPHDNYIDFYPDATGFTYDAVAFSADGTPHRAWLNRGRDAQSYRWRPDAFMPWLTANMQRMHTGFDPDALFTDVFTSIPPPDYYDRSGAFHTRAETVRGWRAAFDASRRLLGHRAPMISESGHDALIGSIDGVEADHWRPDCWLKTYRDADRTPWHDMVTHGKMVLFAGGLGPRYDADPAHGYGSDDYLSNTVLGGRGPMSDGPFSRRAVSTYWLLHDVCDALARAELETHAFGATVRQQHTTFSRGGDVWVNRSSNAWSAAGHALPEYGFFAKTRRAEAGVVTLDGHRAGFAKTDDAFFADARPPADPERGSHIETRALGAERLGPRAYRLTVEWTVLAPVEPGYVPFVHIGRAAAGDGERIEAQAGLSLDADRLAHIGTFQATADIRLPANAEPGDYFVRYGLFHRVHGDRLSLSGASEERRRIRAGILRITTAGDAYLLPEPAQGNADTNVAGAMLDFGPLVTDGAFRLLHGDRRAWQLVPLPGSRPFRAELRLGAFGASKRKVSAVERVDPFFAFAKTPEWHQDGDTLWLACDARAFGYRIVFE